ncbi:MAG: GLUG motif-containing protein [bacterium]
MRKKVFVWLLTFLMALGMIPATAFADESVLTYGFADMPNNWSTASLTKAVDNGLLKGYADGNKILIKADAPLKRAEMAAVINRAFGAIKAAGLNGVTDVPSTAWYANDMAKAIMMRTFMKDIKMRPEDSITRQEAFVVLARAFKISSDAAGNNALGGFSDKDDVAAWAKNELNGMVEAGYVRGSNGILNPNANISRAEFATVMDNLVKQYIDVAGEVTDVVSSGNVLIRVPGVTLKNLTIKGDLIIADGVGEGDVTLDNVTVQGRTVVRGGGENSIIIKGNSNLGKVIVCKVDGKIRIAVEDTSDVEIIYVDDGSDDVLVEGVIGTLEVAGDGITATATKGNIDNAIVSGDNSTIILKTSGTLKEGKISGTASKIIVEKGAIADKIFIDGADAAVEGTGVVKDVEIRDGGDNASVITPNTRIKAAKGVEGITAAGGAPVKSGTSVINNNAGTWIVAPSYSGGRSSRPVVSAANIATDIDITGGVENDAVVEVTLTTATSGAEIYYTTDGSIPTASSTKYTGPFNIETENTEGETVTIKAIGIKSGSNNSAVAEKKIVFRPAILPVVAIDITRNPEKITYYEGDTLDLSGLRVKLIYSDWSEEIVELPDFVSKSITTDPVNGSTLTIVEHNGKKITVSCNGSSDSGDPLTVLAAIPSEFAGGNGTIANPYQVATAEQLDNVRNHLDKHFIQTEDIDLAEYLADGGAGYNDGAGWEPIGVFVSGDTGSPFTGSYNGNGKTISNLNINSIDEDYVGLFEYSKGNIDNVTLLEVDISGKATVGGLVGCQNGGAIVDCSVSGSVNGTGSRVGGLIGESYEVVEVIGCYSTASVEGLNDVGGLIGYNSYSTIEKCHATGNVKGNSSTTGGLVASNYNGVIKNCYATGSVYGLYDEVGGLVGWNAYSEAQIINSYATGQVTGGGERIGGLVGRNHSSAIVDKCYSTGKVSGGTKVGGLIGETVDGATTTNSYWDIQTSGQATSAGGTGYSTSAMIMETNSVPIYVDWDFTDTWAIKEGVSYPYLTWQGDANIPYSLRVQLTISEPTLTKEKQYDGTTLAQVTAGELIGVDVEDEVFISAVANFNDIAVGTGKTITVVYTLSGSDTAKYKAPVSWTTDDGVITKKTLGFSGLLYNTIKEYDGTTAVTLLTSPTLAGVVDGETVDVNVDINYDTADVGSGKRITTVFTISGEHAGNYIKPSDQHNDNGEIVAAADPMPGNSGVITYESNSDTMLTLNWTKASDNYTAEADLKYFVYQSDSDNISTVQNAEENGTLLNVGGAADINTYNVSGLIPETTYYFNVIVADEAGYKAAYSSLDARTKPNQSGSPEFTAGTPATYGTNLTVGLGTLTTTTNLKYWWLRSSDMFYGGDEYILGYSTNNYTPKEADIGNYLIVLVVTPDANGSAILVTDAPVEKAQGPAVTAEYAGTFPIEATSINLTGFAPSAGNLEAAVAIDGTNYTDYAPLVIDGEGKATITDLAGITTSTKVKVRVKETSTHKAGAGKEITVTEEIIAPVIPEGKLLHAAAGSDFTGVVYEDKNDSKIYYSKVGTDGVWGTKTEVVNAGADIRIAIDSDDIAHVAYSTGDKIGYRMYDGNDWTAETTIESNNGGECSKPDIALDSNGYTHITYSDTKGNIGDYTDRSDIMYAVNTSGSFIKTLIYNGYYESYGGADAGADYYDKGSLITVDLAGNYYILTHHYDFYKWMSGSDKNYSLNMSSNLKQDQTLISNAGSDIFDIYDLTESNGKIVALYNHSGAKTAELTESDGTFALSEVQSLIGGTVNSVSTDGTNIVAAGVNGDKLQAFYNGTAMVYSEITVKSGTKVSVVHLDSTFYAIYTDSDDKIKAMEIEPPLEP